MRPRWPPTMHSNLHMRHVTQSQNSKFPRWRKLVEAKVVRPQMYRVLMIKWGDLWALNPRKKSPFVFCVLVWLDRVKQRLFRYFKNIFSCAVRARSHLQVQNWICKYVVCHFVFTSPLFAGMYFHGSVFHVRDGLSYLMEEDLCLSLQILNHSIFYSNVQSKNDHLLPTPYPPGTPQAFNSKLTHGEHHSKWFP